MGTLPDWCTPLPDAETMRATDRWAIEQRQTSSLDLMERAGAGVARAVEELAPDGPIAIVCGKGNNGGDGLVAARLLREAGRTVTVLTSAAPEELTGDAHANLVRLPGEPPRQSRDGDERLLGEAVAIVDALLGTGFTGEPHGAVRSAIEAINRVVAAADAQTGGTTAHSHGRSRGGPAIVSVDVPSGVDASTGTVAGCAVRATLTVTFHAAKPGLWIHPGKAHAGTARTLDIGIPRGGPRTDAVGLIESRALAELPRRGSASTKFSSGHVLVVGGSRDLSGAPRMSARAALRAGAGYVTACVPSSLQAILAAGETPELMTRGLSEHAGELSPTAVPPVLELARRGGALALGPGLGRGPGARELARALAREARVATVIDADALNAHAGELELFAARTHPTVLTPHAGELARLLRCESVEVERERLRHVRAAAARAQAVTVLKGDDTLIAAPDGPVLVSPGGSPALATAGTGDVLTGVIAALLAQGLAPLTAAAAGVWMHAAAGRLAARHVGAPEGVIATDVIAALPAARAGGDA